MQIYRSVFTAFAVIVFVAGAIAQSPPETPLNRPLRIVSKPHAAYPVAAQRAMVTGDVHLRITFLANGSIGEIVCVNTDEDQKSLFEQYGLIESAQQAARKIKFEPKIVNGKETDVRATLAYGFRMR